MSNGGSSFPSDSGGFLVMVVFAIAIFVNYPHGNIQMESTGTCG